MGFVEEQIVEWSEEERMSLQVYKLKGMPVKDVKGHYQLTSSGEGTCVTHWIEYETKGPLGILMKPITKSMFMCINRWRNACGGNRGPCRFSSEYSLTWGGLGRSGATRTL